MATEHAGAPDSLTIRLTLEYDGSAYSGWQWQPDRPTVEGALRHAVRVATGGSSRLSAAGRTDAGAHAHGQVVGITLERRWEPGRLQQALNSILPADIVVRAAAVAPPGFHARFDAVSRTYRYLVAPRRSRQAVARQYAWQVSGDLDLGAMQRAATVLVGRHDFAGFGRAPRDGGSTVRTVERIEVRRAPVLGVEGSADSAVVIEVVADAFLYGMMRSIAGALVTVGQGRLELADVAACLRSQSRDSRHPVAPAHGLHQWTVIYPALSDEPGPAQETR